MTDLAIEAFVTLLVILDPIGTAAVFVGLTAGARPADRRRMAWRGVAIAAAVLLAFALIGREFLERLGISFAAFRIAGGVLLFLLAIDMVFARRTGLRATTPPEDEEAVHSDDISVFPLAIPLLAGPGATTSVMLLTGASGERLAAGAVVIAVLLAVLATTLACLLMAERIGRALGVTGTNVVSRLLGLILAALAAQFVLDGVQAAL